MKNLDDLREVMRRLRGPKGCPWDKVQTPESLTPYAVEEALELEDAIHNKSKQDVLEELGDLLFQVVFHCQMAEERGDFTMDDVIHVLTEKMTERHPHVFGDLADVKDRKGVMQMWEKNKSSQKNAKTIFEIPKNFPSLLTAVKIGKKTRTIDFDWYKVEDVFRQFMSEVAELKATLKSKDKAHQQEEVGDALFTLAQVARILDVDPEKALRLSNQKVVRRIRLAYDISKLSWKEFCALTIEEKEKLWEKAKKQIKAAKASATKKPKSKKPASKK